MPFTVPKFTEIRDQYLNQVRNLQPGAATGPDSDHYVRAAAVAAVAEQLYAHQAWVFRQAFPDTADAENLERMAAQRGVPRKTAAYAIGSVRLVGVPGTVVPAGVGVATTSMSYTTTAAGVIGGGGSVDVAAVADRTGEAGNVSAPISADVSGAPAGVSHALVVAMAEGAADETSAALLDRLLAVMSQPAQGGNRNDYVVWALEVPGVRRAYVFPLRRGVGTVDVVPMPEAGLPSAQLLADVQAHIDTRKPVGLSAAGFLAIAPAALVTAITGTLTLKSGYTLAQVQPLATTALTKLLTDTAPGETLYRTRILATVMNVDGVANVVLTAPAADVVPTVDNTVVQLATLGAITLTLGA
jgi:uncharacterized phage protein gp47/JayE